LDGLGTFKYYIGTFFSKVFLCVTIIEIVDEGKGKTLKINNQFPPSPLKKRSHCR